jgi:hypothetical protein
MTARQEPGDTASDGVSRLLDAERTWARSLEAARAEANEVVRLARAEADRIDHVTAEDIRRLVDERRRELAASTDEAVRAVDAELTARAARYAQGTTSAVEAAAGIIADAAPWLTPRPRARP